MLLNSLSLAVEGIVGRALQGRLQSPLGELADSRSGGTEGARGEHCGGIRGGRVESASMCRDDEVELRRRTARRGNRHVMLFAFDVSSVSDS